MDWTGSTIDTSCNGLRWCASPPFVYGEALFPTLTFRRAYDVLAERSERWADLEYVRILHLAATTMEYEVEAALAALLEAGEVPEYEHGQRS